MWASAKQCLCHLSLLYPPHYKTFRNLHDLAIGLNTRKNCSEMLRGLLFTIFLLSPVVARGDLVWQPIIDYKISFPGDRPDAAPIINPFENFTHFSSDFGWMGPGGDRIDSRGGIIHVKPEGKWTGAWHSLAGLAREWSRTLDPRDLTGLGGQVTVRKLSVNASGHGSVRFELADAKRVVLWSHTQLLDNDETTTQLFDIPADLPPEIKFLNWVAEPGSTLRLSSIGFMVERTEMPLEEWAFRISLGKLRRCHDSESGLTRDRGHLPAGVFDSIASTGMQSLGSALGAAEGILNRETTISEIRTTVAALGKLKTASGFLPHFVRRDPSGNVVIHPGTEYSTVDTAIALQSLLLAAQILDLPDVRKDVIAMIAALDFDAVTSADGWISHGFLDDGTTLLASEWRDWGGETALVLALEGMVPGRMPRGKMTNTGAVYRGVGFIAEIQSLFYPDFDRSEPDLVSGVSWPESRKALLARQIAYVKENWPETRSAKLGIFGLSAGEAGMPGSGYAANGTEVMGVRWLHPHYMLMGLALSNPAAYSEGLQRLDGIGHLSPLGLPENIEMELNLYNPMQGSLNAAFETLAAYHGWRKRNSPQNLINQASKSYPLLRQAASRFYPLQ